MKTFLRRICFAVAGLLLLVALFHLVENWRGKRAWAQWKAAREAEGMSYDPASYGPKAIPAADNFAEAPALDSVMRPGGSGESWSLPEVLTSPAAAGSYRAGLRADYQAFARELKGQSLEAILSPYDARLAALAEAARRPGCRLQADYRKEEDAPLLLGMRARSRVLRIRALARLQAGHAEAALEDVLTGLRIAQHLQQEPHLITQLLRLAYTGAILQPIWEGLQSGAWNEAHLARLEEALAPIDLLASMQLAWRFQRAQVATQVSLAAKDSDQAVQALLGDKAKGLWARRFYRLVIPRGWAYQSLVAVDRLVGEVSERGLDPAHHRVHPEVGTTKLPDWGRSPYTRWAPLPHWAAVAGQNLRMAREQSDLDQARVACALERHRRARGRYPERLEELAPTYLSGLPCDLTGGGPLVYARTGKGFRLGSPGRDDIEKGSRSLPANNTQGGELGKGAWVWSRGE